MKLKANTAPYVSSTAPVNLILALQGQSKNCLDIAGNGSRLYIISYPIHMK